MTFRSLSLLVPMRGHPERRARFLESFRRTVVGPVELVLKIDDDDVETLQWAKGLVHPWPVIVSGPRHDGYRSLPRYFNEMSRVATGDLLMCGNDDMEFITKDWAGDLLRMADRYPDGVFDLGIYTYPAGSFPFSCVSRAAVNAMGFLNDERLVFSDIFLRDVMMRFNRAVLLPDTVIMHVGVADDDALQVKDGVHAEAAAYWRLHERCVNEAARAIQPLLKRSWWQRVRRAA